MIDKGTGVIDSEGNEIGVVEDVRLQSGSHRLDGLDVRLGGAVRTLLPGGEVLSLGIEVVESVEPTQVRLRIDKDTLKRLRKKDFIGEGYTIFLPWATYKPEITRVQLKARYEPSKGSPLYASSAPFTLNIDESAIKAGTLLPASHKTSQPASGR